MLCHSICRENRKQRVFRSQRVLGNRQFFCLVRVVVAAGFVVVVVVAFVVCLFVCFYAIKNKIKQKQ